MVWYRHVWLLGIALTLGWGLAQIEGQETRSVTIDGTRVQYHFVTPEGFEPGGTYPTLLVLPPAGGSSSDANDVLRAYFRDEARARGWVVIAALAPYDSSTRMSELFYLGGEVVVPGLLDAVAADVAFEGGKVHLAGVSSGGIGAFRVATLHPERFHSVLVLPGYARDQDLERIGNLAGVLVRMVVGENEDAPDLERIRATAAALDAAGVASELIVVPGDGHRLTSLSGAALFDWLEDQRP